MTSIPDIVRPFTTESVQTVLSISRMTDLQVHKQKLKKLADDLMNLGMESLNNLFMMQYPLDDLFFECELIIRKLIGIETLSSTASLSHADHQGVKLH